MSESLEYKMDLLYASFYDFLKEVAYPPSNHSDKVDLFFNYQQGSVNELAPEVRLSYIKRSLIKRLIAED